MGLSIPSSSGGRLGKTPERCRLPERQDVAKRVPIQSRWGVDGCVVVARLWRKEAREEAVARRSATPLAEHAQHKQAPTIAVDVGPPPARGLDVGEKGARGRSQSGDLDSRVPVPVLRAQTGATAQQEAKQGQLHRYLLRGATPRAVGAPHERRAIWRAHLIQSRFDVGSHIYQPHRPQVFATPHGLVKRWPKAFIVNVEAAREEERHNVSSPGIDSFA